MSEDIPDIPTPKEEPKPKSVFDAPEEPEPGAMTSDSPEEGDPFRMEADIGDTNLYDHAAEAAAKTEKAEAEGVAPPKLPDTETGGINNPTLMENPTDAVKDEMERRFRTENARFQVEATPEDRSRFVRSALHDEELILDIPLEGVGIVVSVAIPPESFTTSAAAATNAWGKEGHQDPSSEMQWLLTFQQMHAWFQIRAVGGEPTPWSAAFADGVPKIKWIREFLADPDNFDAFFTMSATRWRLLADALQLAELKYKVCLDNWRDRSFFTTADTA